ncbi:LMBR1 domain-containing protein [Gaeumannomyces tritici R3-111a-1]|uniref:LMBR1 domain-containing protein n=1 Tax=Gaeumannomyces tritici (strain R3-111a-1) TaxID=644352 RepID=J3PJE1_GAET3|nr:LMBR1 domain-containing protein [Gaeumannomyces tritici R3-111a-1]EJT68807.1 LMBR1 domain-containing protein [Gaeumannomyces tritici R3-111a-1]
MKPVAEAAAAPAMAAVATASAVGSQVFALVALVLMSLTVLLLLRYYLPLRKTPAYLLVPVFFALWLPAAIVLLVPIDLASSAATDDEASRGVWLPNRVLLVSWRITYWLTFVLTWFILPILGEYSDAGHRDPKDKLMYSLRENAQYYAIVLGASFLGLIYLIFSYGIDLRGLKGLVMALAYCWGLVLAIYLMGHGLVSIPRSLLRGASVSNRLRRLQARAPRLYERMEEAEAELADLEAQVAELARRGKAPNGGTARDYQDWIEELIDMTTTPEDGPQLLPAAAASGASRALPTIITEKYMAELTRQLVRARHARSRYVGEWAYLLRQARDTQAVLDSAGSKQLDFGRAGPGAGFWDRLTVHSPYTRHIYHFHVLPWARTVLGAVLAAASACIVWSEMIKVALPSLSVVRLSVVHHWTADGVGQVGFAGQIIAALWILYMAAAALVTVTEVRVWRGRALVRRNTAHESAFWYASQVARLSVPLSYNFMTFLSPAVYKPTTFYIFLGQLINLTPLGAWFDYLFPVFIIVPVCATMFGLYAKVRRMFGFDVDFIGGDGSDDDEDDDVRALSGYGTGSWREGRDLIERELAGTSIRQRRLGLGAGAGGAGGAGPAGRAGRAAPVLSIPGAAGSRGLGSGGGDRSSRTPLATSPSGGLASSRGAGGSSRRGGRAGATVLGEDDEDDNFFQALGHRMKNTIDSIDAPKWWQEIGEGIKKPKWMGGDDDANAGGSSSRAGGGGGDGPDLRRWFGGGDGRIRL